MSVFFVFFCLVWFFFLFPDGWNYFRRQKKESSAPTPTCRELFSPCRSNCAFLFRSESEDCNTAKLLMWIVGAHLRGYFSEWMPSGAMMSEPKHFWTTTFQTRCYKTFINAYFFDTYLDMQWICVYIFFFFNSFFALLFNYSICTVNAAVTTQISPMWDK